jgi:HAD superfamily hydrolase (TIGR01490 family)
MVVAMDYARHATDSRTDLQKAAPVKPLLALFDFDGTITSTDTLWAFLRFSQSKTRLWTGLVLLSPWLVLYRLRLLANWHAKNALFTWYFAGESVEAFQAKCDAFARTVIPGLVRPAALAAVRRYQEQGATVVVVSATPENWLQPWCDAIRVAYIGTRLEVKNGTLTGRIAGKNCHGPEKVCRVSERYDMAAYAEIHAYGDSHGDTELLALATRGFFKPFRSAKT